MGNALSEEEQEQIMEEAYNLEDPGSDKQLNIGTSAPNCQPEKEGEHRNSRIEADVGVETATGHKNQRTSSTMSVREEQEDQRKRQHTSSSSSSLSSQQQQEQDLSAAAQQQKKLSYFQMARLGYQELVNAIIRPPRADYKVCSTIWDNIRLVRFNESDVAGFGIVLVISSPFSAKGKLKYLFSVLSGVLLRVVVLSNAFKFFGIVYILPIN